MWGKHCSKTKTMQGKHCSNPQYFFFLKATKLISQPAQYIKKNRQRLSKKRRSQFWVKEIKKKCIKKETKAKKKKHVGKATVF